MSPSSTYIKEKLDSKQHFYTCASRHTTVLTKPKNAAYWIAFGPHGPRALPPPGENWYVFRMTMYGIGVSLLLFVAIRSQARPAPKTMNAQYQEMTNEYLKVRNGQACLRHRFAFLKLYSTNNDFSLETKNRTHHRYIIGRLCGQRNGAEQAKKRGRSVGR